MTLDQGYFLLFVAGTALNIWMAHKRGDSMLFWGIAPLALYILLIVVVVLLTVFFPTFYHAISSGQKFDPMFTFLASPLISLAIQFYLPNKRQQ